MTKQEYLNLKKGDKITHCLYPSTICVIDSDKTEHGFFHRPQGSRGGWNTISESTCQYYNREV